MRDPRRATIELGRPETWPSGLIAVLTDHHDAFRSRERGPLSGAYDAAVYAVVDALRPYSIVGWHCTRLADHEIDDIKASGLALLDVDLVVRRVDAAIQHGLISAEQGTRLKATNQAGEQYRAGMLWFCFFRPALAGEAGSVISSATGAVRPSTIRMTGTRKWAKSSLRSVDPLSLKPRFRLRGVAAIGEFDWR